jgi:hypothetical protein
MFVAENKNPSVLAGSILMSSRIFRVVVPTSTKVAKQVMDTERKDRKVIHVAGVLVIQPDAELASRWQSELVDFGMTGTVTTTSIDDAIHILTDQSFLGVVVAASSVGEASRAIVALRADDLTTGNEEGLHVPVLLVLNGANRANDVVARRLGYEAILPAPVHSRLIYRRMGSLMQKARRGAKRREIDAHGGGVDIAIAAQRD